MRIRSTKPEFWKSKRITSVSWDARLVLKGLESYVDDNGVGVDDIELIVTDVFPRDMFANGSETVARVSEAVSELHRAGLVHRYASDDDNLLFISFWEEVQRIDKPGRGRKPRPDGTFEYKASSIRESVANVPVTLALGTGEQGNRGTELIAHPADTQRIDFENLFNTFWRAWPVKKGKEPARKAFIKAMKSGTSFDTIMAGVEAYKRELGPISAGKTLDGRTPKWAQGWLNDQRWTDEPDTPTNITPSAAASIGRPSAADQCLLGVHGKRTATNECVVCGERLETNPF